MPLTTIGVQNTRKNHLQSRKEDKIRDKYQRERAKSTARGGGEQRREGSFTRTGDLG